MEKILSLALVVVMILAMTVSVFAAEVADVTPTASCTHSGGRRTETQVTYIYNNNSTHNKYRTYVYYCASCGAYLSNSGATLLGSEAHTHGTGTWYGSSHAGDYTSHYYKYRGSCTICAHSITWTVKAACQANYCIDPA